MLNLAILDTQPSWMYTAAQGAAEPDVAGQRPSCTPGVAGLEAAVLEHLVESRYAAAVAGGTTWAVRFTAEVHAAAGKAHGATLAATEAAIHSLVTRDLVMTDRRDGRAGWSATPCGVSAADRAHDIPLLRAA